MLFTVFAMGCLLLQELGFDSIVDSRCGNQHFEVAEEKLADLVVREASFPKLYAVRSTFSRTMFGVNRAIEIQGKQILFVDKAKDKVIGSGTIFIEKKFLRQTGIVDLLI